MSSYSSYSPNDERFGFHTAGYFRCSYKHERLGLIIGMCVIAAWLILIIMNFAGLFSLFDDSGTLKGGLVDVEGIQHGNIHEAQVLSDDFIKFGTYNIANAAGIIVLVLLVGGFIVLFSLLKVGGKYYYTADEEKFTVTRPKGEKDTIVYTEVLAVHGEERRFPFAVKGLDVTVYTKSGQYFYQFIHTPLSRTSGISETPFHIIMERAELAKKPLFLEKEAYKNEDTWKQK